MITGLLAVPVQFTSTIRFGVLLGVELDDSVLVWSRCPFYGTTQETFQSIQALLTEYLYPVLSQRPLTPLLPHFETLFQVERTAVYETVHTPEKKSERSRRALLRLEEEEQPEPTLVQNEVQEPLPLPLLEGIVTLLIKAAATVTQQSPLEVLAGEVEVPITKLSPRPTHITLPNLGETMAPFTPTLRSMGYAVLPYEEEAMMGQDGALFQRHVRQLKEHLQSSQPKGNHIYLELLGAYGRLYNNELGRILGACAGLEHSVKPCTVWLEDPILVDEEADNEVVVNKLSTYLRLRRLKTQLVAHFGIDSVTAVEHVISSKRAHAVHLSLYKFHNLTHLLDALKLCQAQKVTVILGDRHSTPELLAWLGMLFQVRLVYTATPQQTADVTTAMYQTAVEQSRRAGII